MRDPKRIQEMLEAINSIWSANPELRLMQLLINYINTNKPSKPYPELYYLEDDEMLKRLQNQ